MISRRSFASMVGLLLLWLVLSASAFGQVAGGAISGTVTDASGALVPNADRRHRDRLGDPEKRLDGELLEES